MDRFLSKAQVHHLLQECGHTVSSAGEDRVPTDVCPPPETYLTIGSDVDCTLKPGYRARYFACVRDESDEPRIQHAPAFELWGHFVTAVQHRPRNNDFVRGPVCWLLSRIRQCEHVLLWPVGGFRGKDGLDFLRTLMTGERFDEAPHLARWLDRHAPSERTGGMRLSLSDLDDCRVLWEAANLVGAEGYDFYLSDSAAHEVYLMHHHDKLVISIPNAQKRQALIEELGGQTDLFEDYSGYWFETDEEHDG